MKIFTQTLKIFILATALFGMSAGVMGQVATDLMITEYIEGSSNNKAIEIYNGTGVDVDLSQYSLKKEVNGANGLKGELVLTGTLEKGKCYVIVNSSAIAEMKALANKLENSITSFNGNDAVGLFKQGTLIDIVGILGQVEIWGADLTLVRNSTVLSPTSSYSAGQWTTKAKDDYSNLGQHSLTATTTPQITVPSSLVFENINFNTSKAENINIKGANLTSDITISGLTTPFSTTVTTITKEQAMTEDGFDVPVTFAPTAKGEFNTKLTISSADLTTPLEVNISAIAFAVEEVANITELRTKWTGTVDPTTYYKITGESLVSFANGKNYYMQDNQAGVLAYDVNTLISPALAINDGVKGITGKLELYNNMLELIVTEPTAEDVTNNNTITPVSVAAADFVANFDQYEGRLVKIANVEFPTTTTAFKSTAESLDVTSDGTSFVVRTFANSDYAGETIPTQTTVTGLAVIYKTTIQLSPRFKADIASLSTAIETPTLAEGSVFVSNGQIVVKAETAGALIEVYNIAGQRLVSQVAEAGRNSFTLAKGQIYVVKIGNLVKKVVL